MEKIHHIFLLLILSVLTMTGQSANAQRLSDLILIADDNEGTFLGTFENEYTSNSVFNEYGNYGSQYSSKSIFNQYSQYGSEYSSYSPFNAYASNPPLIVDKDGNFYGRLSINRYARGVTNESYQLAMKLKARWNALNK